MKKFIAFLLAFAFCFTSAGAQTVSTSGTITGASCVVLPLTPGQSNASIQLTGTFTSGTINFLISNDGTNYFVSPTDSITSATAIGLSFVTVASARFVEACGSSVVGSVAISLLATPAVAPKGGGGASAAVNITAVGGNAVTTTIPVSGTVTITPSGTQTVAQPTAANLNATVVQGTAASLQTTAQANIANFAGSATTTALGVPSQQLYPANVSGGGCQGVNLTTGTQITKTFFGQVNSSTTTQFIALAASKIIHICSMSYNGTVTTGGQLTITAGTGANCATGPVVLWRLDTGTGNYTDNLGNGGFSILESPSANEICVTDTSVGTTRTYFTYAQY